MENKCRECRVVTTESETVEVDECLIGGRCIELNPNTLRPSPDACALLGDGDNKEDGICECERGEAKRFRFCGGGYNGWGPDARLSSVREGIRRKMPIAKTTAASVLGSRGVVGTASRAGLGGSVPVLILDGWVTLYLEWWTNNSRVTTSISSLFSERNLYTS